MPRKSLSLLTSLTFLTLSLSLPLSPSRLIVEENMKEGVGKGVWDVSGAGQDDIIGFATKSRYRSLSSSLTRAILISFQRWRGGSDRFQDQNRCDIVSYRYIQNRLLSWERGKTHRYVRTLHPLYLFFLRSSYKIIHIPSLSYPSIVCIFFPCSIYPALPQHQPSCYVEEERRKKR